MAMKILVSICVCFAFWLAAWPTNGQAQSNVPQSEFFVGKSEVWVRSSRFERRHGAFEASITGNLNRFVGLEFDFKSPQRHLGESQKLFFAGPHFTFRGASSVNPFVHVLLGVAHGKRLTGPGGFHSVGRWVFTTAAGGGFDVKVTQFLWIRAIQVDYLTESYPPTEWVGGDVRLSSTDVRQNNVTLSFGVVFRFRKLGG